MLGESTLQIILKLLSGSKAGQQIVLPSDDCSLGRGDDCGVQLNSKHISRRHCQIKIEDGHVWVRDLSSRNGTCVNHERLEGQRRLQSGDILKVGNFKFELQLLDNSASDAPGAAWLEFCRAVNEIDVPKTSGSEASSLTTVDIPGPPSTKPSEQDAKRQTPAGEMLPPQQPDSRSAAQEALRRYFSGR